MLEWEANSSRIKVPRVDKVKLFLYLIFVLAVFFTVYLEVIILFFRAPQSGEAAYFTFRSLTTFNFDQEKAFKGLRNAAIAQYSPIYVYLPKEVAATKAQMEDFIKEVFKDRDQGKTGREALAGYLKKEYRMEISSQMAERLLRYPDLRNLLAGILTIQESISQGKIVDDPGPFKGKMTIRVLYPDPLGISAFPVDEVTTLEKARLDLEENAHQLFWQVNSNILNPVLQIALATLKSNLSYDQKENERGIEEIIRKYPSEVIIYQPVDVLVPFRKVLNEKDMLLLTASQEAAKKELYASAPWVLFIICFSILLYNWLLLKIFSPFRRMKPPYQLFLTVLFLTILLTKACLLFTPFPVYVLPFAVLPLLLVLLRQERIYSIFTTVLGALLISLFSGRNLAIFIFLTFGGLVAILTSFRLRKRFHILIPSLLVGTTNAVMVLLLLAGSYRGMVSLGASFRSLQVFMGWAIVGGLSAGPLVLLILPVLELSWQYASTFKINKYSDLQHPLMVELLTKAPGTYQHSMTEAHLAYSLGEAIGANSLLLRVAAYYHDIGKTANPDFFVENLFGRKSPHDALPALESARIIMDHVTEGKRIAREAGLPEVVVDFIPQHHGTLLIEYFYDKARKENREAVVSQKDFRHSGPKPQSVEAAILMIADAVEATSRTIEEPTRENIEAMIRHIIVDRITDGQFDECDLSTRELAKIKEVLIHELEASFHTRIEYPWQQKELKEIKIDR